MYFPYRTRLDRPMKMQHTSYMTNENIPYCDFFGVTSFRFETNVKTILKKMNISGPHHVLAIGVYKQKI